jgi:hypothetical protein
MQQTETQAAVVLYAFTMCTKMDGLKKLQVMMSTNSTTNTSAKKGLPLIILAERFDLYP